MQLELLKMSKSILKIEFQFSDNSRRSKSETRASQTLRSVRILLTHGLPIVKFPFVNRNCQISRNRSRSIARHQILKTRYESKRHTPRYYLGLAVNRQPGYRQRGSYSSRVLMLIVFSKQNLNLKRKSKHPDICFQN